MLEVTSFLGTPLVTKGRTVGILAVDNRLSGSRARAVDGPAPLHGREPLAAAIENARLYAEIETQNRDLEARVAADRRSSPTRPRRPSPPGPRPRRRSATKSTFLASVSHELRTPLTSVVGFTKLVRKRFEDVVTPALAGLPDGAAADPKLDRAVRQIGENLGIIVDEGERLTAMINDMLDLAEDRGGPDGVPARAVDLLAASISRATSTSARSSTTTGLALVARRSAGRAAGRSATTIG